MTILTKLDLDLGSEDVWVATPPRSDTIHSHTSPFVISRLLYCRRIPLERHCNDAGYTRFNRATNGDGSETTFKATFMNGVIKYVWIVSVVFGTLSKQFSFAQIRSFVAFCCQWELQLSHPFQIPTISFRITHHSSSSSSMSSHPMPNLTSTACHLHGNVTRSSRSPCPSDSFFFSLTKLQIWIQGHPRISVRPTHSHQRCDAHACPPGTQKGSSFGLQAPIWSSIYTTRDRLALSSWLSLLCTVSSSCQNAVLTKS